MTNEDFRTRLLTRLIRCTGATSAGLALAAACGGSVETDDVTSSHGGGTGTGGTSPQSSGGGGATGGAATSTGGTFGFAGTGGGIFTGTPDASFPQSERAEVCFSPTDGAAILDAAACAPAEVQLPDPATFLDLCNTGGVRSLIVDGPRLVNGACCYDVRYDCYVYVGRAFLADAGLIKAPARRGTGWRTGPSPRVADLSEQTRRALCEAWLKDGLFEHASVATFSRFALQLIAVGAPSYLLHETLAAARDEIRHAELCFALASAYAGEPLEPAGLPVPSPLPVDTELADLVTETVIEGCIGETLAAVQAAASLELARDPAVVAALADTLEDETRHAELAWRVVAWAIEVGGPTVKDAVERAFSGFRAPETPDIDLDGIDQQKFEEHGRLAPDKARLAALGALHDVVRPCAAALLAKDVLPVRATSPIFQG